MNNEYLRAFVIGSSFFVFLPYFFFVSRFNTKDFNFTYVPYTFLAPVALGLMNMLSLFIASRFNLTKKNRYLLISILAPSMVTFTILFFKLYNYTIERWVSHIVKLYLLYFFVWNVVVYNLDKYV
jgi:hypothetical protein